MDICLDSMMILILTTSGW